MPLGMRLTGDWEKTARILSTLTPRVRQAMGVAVLQEGHFLRKKMLASFDAGGPEGSAWAPHSPWTRAVRLLLGNQKSKLLIQSGDLRGSIGVMPVDGGKGGCFVGIRRSARTSYPGGVVNLALLHEEG